MPSSAKGGQNLSTAIATRQQQRGQQPDGENSVYSLVQSMAGEFSRAMPSVIQTDAFMRLALTELRTKPTLMACTPESLLGALMTAARLGLEPGGPLGQFWLTPRKIDSRMQVVPIIGYKGLRDLALRTGKVDSIQSFLIREGDTFAYGSDEQRGFWHEWRPLPDGDDDRPWTGVLTIARLSGTAVPIWRHLSHRQVMARKAKGSAGDKGPWHDFEEAMAMKTGIRAIVPDLPSSSVLADANRVDEQVQVWKRGQDEPQQLEANSDPQPEVEGSSTEEAHDGQDR